MREGRPAATWALGQGIVGAIPKHGARATRVHGLQGHGTWLACEVPPSAQHSGHSAQGTAIGCSRGELSRALVKTGTRNMAMGTSSHNVLYSTVNI